MNRGYYIIKITGKDPYRFLKTLYKHNFSLYQVEMLNNILIIKVDYETSKKIKKLKTTYKIEIIDAKGILWFKEKLKQYFCFIIILFLGFLLLYTLSNVIFSIEVIHSNQELRNLILLELKERNVEKFHFFLSFKEQEEVVKSILNENNDKIEWLEIERVGTKYVVKVEERKINNEKTETEPQNVIAKKDGMILKIEAIKGEVVKKKNDYVKKGDIIISGTIKNQEEEKAKVRAEGKIYAETWYQTTVEMPLHYKEEKLTGSSKNKFMIDFLNYSFNLFDFSPYKNKRIEKVKIISNPLIPFSISFTNQKELEVIDEVYSYEEAVLKASQLAFERLEKTLAEDSEIIFQKTLKIERKESKIIIDVFFKVSENITDYELITDKLKIPLDDTNKE